MTLLCLIKISSAYYFHSSFLSIGCFPHNHKQSLFRDCLIHYLPIDLLLLPFRVAIPEQIDILISGLTSFEISLVAELICLIDERSELLLVHDSLVLRALIKGIVELLLKLVAHLLSQLAILFIFIGCHQFDLPICGELSLLLGPAGLIVATVLANGLE